MVFNHSSKWSKTVHGNVKIGNLKIIEEMHIDAGSGVLHEEK